MIENTDAEQVERLNARVVDLLREVERLQDAKRRALAIADERAIDANELRFENERLRIQLAGRHP
jgi:regulator of replication initiation timing